MRLAFRSLAFWSLADEAQLAWVGLGNRLRFGWTLEIVVVRVELTDQLVQFEGRFPDVEQQSTPLAATLDGAAAVNRRIVPPVPGAAAVKFSGPNLQPSRLPF